MNINKKYAVFGAAAVIAVAGVIYFGTSANQQASVAALNLKTASDTTNTISTGIGPITTNPINPNDPSWIKLCRDGKPYIQVLSPNGGEVYQAGQQIPVTWRSCNITSNVGIFIDLIHTVNDPSGREWGFSSINDGQELVNAPINYGAYTSGKFYKVLVYPNTVASSTTRDQSNNTFTINPIDAWAALCADGQPHIQVISPNGGEVYQIGQQVTVKWRTCNDNSDSSVSAILTTNQSSNNRLLGHSPADINTATFTIPSTLSGLNNTTVPIVSGQYYKINLELRTNFGTNDLMASDNSNNTFTINEITGLSTTLASTLNPISTVSSTSGAVTSVLYRIRLNVTANRSDFYIPRGATFIKGANTATVPSLVSPQNGISFGILNESNLYVDGATTGRIATPATEVSSSVSIVSGASIDPSGRIKVPQGQTAVFDIAVTISEGVVSSDVFGRYKIGILSVNGATTATGPLSNFNTTPVVNYQTQFNSPAFQ